MCLYRKLLPLAPCLMHCTAKHYVTSAHLTWKDPQTHYWRFKVHFQGCKIQETDIFQFGFIWTSIWKFQVQKSVPPSFLSTWFFLSQGYGQAPQQGNVPASLFSSLLISVTIKWGKTLRKNIFVGSNFRNKMWFLNRHYGVINLFFSQFISSHVLWLCPWMWFWIMPASEPFFDPFLSSLSSSAPTVSFQIVHRFSAQDIKSNPYSINNRTLQAFPFIWR